MEVFSARLKWLRERNGLSQKQMSEILEISQPYYFKFEKGIGQPNLETLAKLPAILNESLDFLLGLTDYDKETQEVYNSYRDKLREIDFHVKRIKRAEERLRDLDEYEETGVAKNEPGEKATLKIRLETTIKLTEEDIVEDVDKLSLEKEKLKTLLASVPLISEKTKTFLETLK